jgi:hypothetical protein
VLVRVGSPHPNEIVTTRDLVGPGDEGRIGGSGHSHQGGDRDQCSAQKAQHEVSSFSLFGHIDPWLKTYKQWPGQVSEKTRNPTIYENFGCRFAAPPR